MNSIRILSKKISYCSPSAIIDFTKYSNELNKLVKIQKGFILSESFWGYCLDKQFEPPKENIIYTLSEWKSVHFWNNWFHSEERDCIKRKYKDILHNESFRILIKNKDREDMFLL